MQLSIHLNHLWLWLHKLWIWNLLHSHAAQSDLSADIACFVVFVQILVVDIHFHSSCIWLTRDISWTASMTWSLVPAGVTWSLPWPHSWGILSCICFIGQLSSVRMCLDLSWALFAQCILRIVDEVWFNRLLDWLLDALLLSIHWSREAFVLYRQLLSAIWVSHFLRRKILIFIFFFLDHMRMPNIQTFLACPKLASRWVCIDSVALVWVESVLGMWDGAQGTLVLRDGA